MTLTVSKEHLGALGVLRDLHNLSDANPEDLSSAQVTALRGMFEDPTIGLFLFATEIFGYRDLTTSLHLPICTFLGRWGQSELESGEIITHPPTESDGPIKDSYRRLMVRIPRECFKTSLCTRANALWVISRNPNATIAIFNEKVENSERWVGAIARVVESSKLYQTLWRDVIPKGIGWWDKEAGIPRGRSHKWGDTGLLFERGDYGIPELSIEPHGVGGATTGKHFTHMILDDIIGRESAYSTAVMQAAIDWVDNQRPLERPAENGNELVVHTPWAFADVYKHKLTKWPGEYKLHVRHILEDASGHADPLEGKSIFPNKISTVKAQQLLKTDPFINWAQYMCIPRAGRDQSFDEKWLRYGRVGGPVERLKFRIDDGFYDPEICDPESGEEHAPQIVPLSWMNKCILLDPAPSKNTEIKKEPRANNGIVVVGVDPWGRRYCLEALGVREGPTELLHRLIDLGEKWGTLRIGIEEVNFSAIYAPLWEQILRHERPDLKVEFFPLSPKLLDAAKGKRLEKEERIRQSLIRVFENGFWYINHEGCGRLVQEILEFPHGETKDIIDALAYTDRALDRPNSPSQEEAGEAARKRLSHHLGATGYGEFT